MEQLVARRAHNPKVTRSSRVPATKAKALRKLGAFAFFVDQSLLSFYILQKTLICILIFLLQHAFSSRTKEKALPIHHQDWTEQILFVSL